MCIWAQIGGNLLFILLIEIIFCVEIYIEWVENN